jgi:hypothetical protein
MGTFETPQQSWEGMLHFYDGFRGHAWWSSLGPFRRLVVARSVESEWGQRLWASQSHEVLEISRSGKWP